MNPLVKNIIIGFIGLIIALALIYVLSPLFSKKVEVPRNPQIDSLGAVISEMKKDIKGVKDFVTNSQQKFDANENKTKHDVKKIKEFTPSSRDIYTDSLERANGL